MSPLDSLSVRVASLKTLKPGWCDGEGKTLNTQALDWVELFFTRQCEWFDLQVPYLYPTPDGNLRAEWTVGSWEVSADLDLETREANVHGYNVENLAETEAKFDLKSHGAKFSDYVLSVWMD